MLSCPATGLDRMHRQYLRNDVMSTLWARPDEVMLEHGAGGELLVAKIRAVLSALILLLPLTASLGGAGSTETLIGLGMAVLVNIIAQVWLVLARDHRRHRWLPYATGTYDVSATTVVLALMAWHDPAAGLNSIVVWCLYAIAIVVTALRNDGRLTLYVGGMAIVQYAIMVAVIIGGSPETLASIDYGTVSTGGQIQRLILLLMITLLTCAIVYRMQRLILQSGRDGLTGLPNRAWLLQHIPRLFDAARANGHTVTMALIDLDHFKRINDLCGHRSGDRAIRHISAFLSDTLGEHEQIARIGGQEFVILLQGPIGSAWERLDRARRNLGQQPFHPERGTDAFKLGFSAGLAAFPQDGGDASALLGCADRRLQQAKRDGRGRINARDI